MSSIVTYGAVLDVKVSTVTYVVGLLDDLRCRLGTRAGTRALTCWAQAVLVLRWFVDGARVSQLVRDNQISASTGYKYLHEGIDVLAARAPSLSAALETAKGAGWSHLNLDGTVIGTDRIATPGPDRADLWWSGKHKHHGGNVQVLSDPDGWPIWTSDVRPGREHDTTCATAAPGLVEGLESLTGHGILTLVDLGYLGVSPVFRTPRKKPAWRRLNLPELVYNRVFRAVHGIGERANSLLKTTFKALRRVSLNPWRIGDITKATLVILHIEHNQALPATTPLHGKAQCPCATAVLCPSPTKKLPPMITYPPFRWSGRNNPRVRLTVHERQPNAEPNPTRSTVCYGHLILPRREQHRCSRRGNPLGHTGQHADEWTQR